MPKSPQSSVSADIRFSGECVLSDLAILPPVCPVNKSDSPHAKHLKISRDCISCDVVLFHKLNDTDDDVFDQFARDARQSDGVVVLEKYHNKEMG